MGLPLSREERLAAVVALTLVASQPLMVATTLGLTHVNADSIRVVAPLILGLALPTGLLLLAAPRLLRIPSTPFSWALLVGAGLVLRLLWLGKAPPLDDDFFRYLWDGALVAHGLNPYTWAPDDFISHSDRGTALHRAIAAGAKSTLEHINFPEYRTIYPSVAQAAFALAYLIAPFKVDGLRLVFLVGEISTLWLLVVLLREAGASPFWAALYWWNPFAATMTIGIVHVDALIPPLVLGALWLARRNRINAALVMLALGAGIKIWPLLLAPILLWPLMRQPRRLVLAGLVLAATLLVALGPVLVSAMKPASGLVGYATSWTNNNAFYAWGLVGLKTLLGQGESVERALRLSLALATAFVALWQATRVDAGRPRRFLIVAASVFYLSPAQFPWYAVWFLPLAALIGSWPLLLASALLPFYYLFFPHWPVESGSLFFYSIAFIHSVPVLGWLLMDAVLKRRAGSTTQTGNEIRT